MHLKKFGICFNTPLADNHFTFLWASDKMSAVNSLQYKYEGIKIKVTSVEEICE